MTHHGPNIALFVVVGILVAIGIAVLVGRSRKAEAAAQRRIAKLKKKKRSYAKQTGPIRSSVEQGGLSIASTQTHYNREHNVATADDLAAYLIWKLGPMTPMKINRLAYLCQAASIAVDGHLIFSGRIEAGPAGPLPMELFENHSGKALVEEIPEGRVAMLTRSAQQRIDDVVSRFGRADESRLNQITRYGPWKAARDRHLNNTGDILIAPKELGPYWNDLINGAEKSTVA